MKKLSLLVALLSASSVLAFADDGQVYIDASIIAPRMVGLNANAGYLFNQYLGLEGGLTYIPSSGVNWVGTQSYYMFDGAIKGILPLGDIFSLYGKVGLGLNEYSMSSYGNNYAGQSNLGLLLGAGAAFNLSKDWSLHVEDIQVTGNNPNLLMFGAEYKF